MADKYTLYKEVEATSKIIKVKHKKIKSSSFKKKKKLLTVNKATNIYKKAKSQYFWKIPEKEKTVIVIPETLRQGGKKYFFYSSSIKVIKIKPQIKVYWCIIENKKGKKLPIA